MTQKINEKKAMKKHISVFNVKKTAKFQHIPSKEAYMGQTKIFMRKFQPVISCNRENFFKLISSHQLAFWEMKSIKHVTFCFIVYKPDLLQTLKIFHPPTNHWSLTFKLLLYLSVQVKVLAVFFTEMFQCLVLFYPTASMVQQSQKIQLEQKSWAKNKFQN